jgi:hypothetical protein
MRIHVRRRHRTWILSMTLATAGWAVVWTAVFLRRYVPSIAPELVVAWWIALLFALPGLFLALFTVRARLIWVLLAAVPLFANASLVCLRLLMDEDPAAAALSGTPGERADGLR